MIQFKVNLIDEKLKSNIYQISLIVIISMIENRIFNQEIGGVFKSSQTDFKTK